MSCPDHAVPVYGCQRCPPSSYRLIDWSTILSGDSVVRRPDHAARWKALAKQLWHYRKEAVRSQQAFVDQVHACEALRTDLAAARAEAQHYRDGITWMTTCLGCAELMNKLYAADSGADALRALVGELADALDVHAGGDFCQTHNRGSCNCDHDPELIAHARATVGDG